MKNNVGIYDTILRIFIGTAFAGVFGAMGWIIGVLAVYPIVTGLAAYDPFYQYWNFSTAGTPAEHSDKINYDIEGH